MKISSKNFEDKKDIPAKFTCQGDDINPELFIEDIPKASKSLVLIVDDPDAPGEKPWIHWVLYNIKEFTDSFKIEENASYGTELINSFGKKEYGGPCPPSGTHRYFFRVYALDIKLDLKEEASLQDLKDAMNNHILSEAQIVGLYKKF